MSRPPLEFRRPLLVSLVGTNLAAGLLVLIYFDLAVSPAKGATHLAQILTSLAGFVVLAGLVVPITARKALRLTDPHYQWASGEREPTDADRAMVLATSRTVTVFAVRAWLVVAVVSAVATGLAAPSQFVSTFVGISLAALTAGALTFVVAEDVLRPAVARVLEGTPPPGDPALGIRRRLALAWVLGSGIPLLGIALTPLVRNGGRAYPLAVPVVYLAVVGLWAGAAIHRRTSLAIARPVSEVRDGLRRVREGDLDASVTVDDGGDLGQLEAGFNQMVAGLRDRQRLQDLFGRHVGEDVARQAVESGVVLGGELRDVSVLFVDLINSTGMTESQAATEVVGVLNRFFEAVVSTVAAEGGWVNKFEGDGAMCVFGAPAAQPDSAARALRAARLLHDEVVARGLDAGIGVSCGSAVAGNVGTEDRYEYTVIGRPVNEAARLCEQAKQRPGRVLASQATLAGAGDEAASWSPAGALELRGFAAPTVVYEVAS